MKEGEFGKIALTVEKVVELMRGLHGLDPDHDSALAARIKQLQRLKLFAAGPVGRGRVHLLSLERILGVALVFELAAAGLSTAQAGLLVKSEWRTCLGALLIGWRELRLNAARGLCLAIEHSSTLAGKPASTRHRGAGGNAVSTKVRAIRLSSLGKVLAADQARHVILVRPSQLMADIRETLAAADFAVTAFDLEAARLGAARFDSENSTMWSVDAE